MPRQRVVRTVQEPTVQWPRRYAYYAALPEFVRNPPFTCKCKFIKKVKRLFVLDPKRLPKVDQSPDRNKNRQVKCSTSGNKTTTTANKKPEPANKPTQPGRSTKQISPQPGSSTKESSPKPDKSTKETSAQAGRSTKATSSQAGGSAKQTSPQAIGSTKEISPQAGRSTKGKSPQAGTSAKKSSPLAGKSVKETSPLVGEPTKEESPQAGRSTRETSPQPSTSKQEHSPPNRRVGRSLAKTSPPIERSVSEISKCFHCRLRSHLKNNPDLYPLAESVPVSSKVVYERPRSQSLDGYKFNTSFPSPPSPAPYDPDVNTWGQRHRLCNRPTHEFDDLSSPSEERFKLYFSDHSFFDDDERDYYYDNFRDDLCGDCPETYGKIYASEPSKINENFDDRKRRSTPNLRERPKMNALEDHERKVIIEFCHLLEKSKQLFNGLR